jgi:hypothetical protein
MIIRVDEGEGDREVDGKTHRGRERERKILQTHHIKQRASRIVMKGTGRVMRDLSMLFDIA